VLARVRVGHQPRQVAVAGADLWVSVFGDNAVAQVDPNTGRLIARVRVCDGPQGLAYSSGQVWVGCTNSGQLADVDARTAKVVRRVPYPAADAVTPDGSKLLVTSDNGPSTAVLDPIMGALSQKVRLSDGYISDANADVTADGGAIWVSSPDEGQLYRISR
jgi:DNA-binding beta-propeller fold protein YncE